MKHKVAELEGALLDAAVAMAAGVRGRIVEQRETSLHLPSGSEFRRCANTHYENWNSWEPSTNWQHGGQIIDRERIDFEYDHDDRPPAYYAWVFDFTRPIYGQKGAYAGTGRGKGPTHLIAAMRAYAASKLGDEVEFEEPAVGGMPTAGA